LNELTRKLRPVVEAGSLSGAARHLKTPLSTVCDSAMGAQPQ
jgi:hypothetical protein